MCCGVENLRNIFASASHFTAERTQLHQECDYVLKNKFGNIVFKYPERNIKWTHIIFQGKKTHTLIFDY